MRDTGYTIGHESAKQFMAKYPRREWYNVLRRKLYTSSTHMPKAMVDKLVEFNKQKQMINVTIEHLYRQLGISIPL